MDKFRESPDKILEKIKFEENTYNRGQLKIFFGYAAGVGKTYSMLKAAHSAKNHKIDIVIGYIEPHARPETLKLLNGLEQLPTLKVEHRGIIFHEFDLDKALIRKPQIILIDELAHTNTDKCRHKKRYQDIKELLKAGIDVYTTINVQHIESLNDTIASITGIVVNERIPDSVFDNASQVEFVDIEPKDLIERFNNGKVYKENQAKKALDNFFNIKNLTALREIALRRCADRINQMLEKIRLPEKDNYYTDEHILVCLSSSPANKKIIRNAARMANAFKCNFSALFVETSNFYKMSEENKKRLRENINLAQQLGAVIEIVHGDDIPFQISEFAYLSGVSKIVIGRSNTCKKYFWGKMPLTEKLIKYSPNLDIYIIPDQTVPNYYIKSNYKKDKYLSFDYTDVFKSIMLLLLATIVGILFQKLGFSEANIITIYILSVLLTAVLTKYRIYSLISSFISVLTFNYFFTKPYFTLRAYDDGYPFTFLIMFLSAFITSTLAVKMKQQMKQSSEAAYRTKILLETNQLLQKGKDKDEIIKVTANQLVKLLKHDIIFYIVENKKLSSPICFTLDGKTINSDYINSNENAVANWVYKNNNRAGSTTNTLGNAKCLYLAIRAGNSVYGVIGIATNGISLDTFENNIMLSILGECALALENEIALKEREESNLIAKNEQLRANLLRSISHDLRTPLTSISGNASILMANSKDMDTESCQRLYEDIYDDSLWLINLVENLLSVTRIEDGTMKLRLSAELIDEVITEALKHINRKSSEHKIIVNQSDEFILAKIDARLIIQVIINIIDNAIKYTPSDSEIIIKTYKENNMIIVDISDNGNGIDEKDKNKIFEMFYTANKGIADSRRSLGLGLALCKSIIIAHGGKISVLDNKPKGTIFRFTLPEEEVILNE